MCSVELIKQCALQCRMPFNADPQKQAVDVLFSRKNIAIDHPEICLDNILLVKANKYKHLGVILDSKLYFLHISMQLSLRQE